VISPFDPNDYRKRVLAVVERRGGPDSSDAFELYDIPLDGADRLKNSVVAARVAEVFAFWQRQRDHPKYGSLVTLLVEAHAQRSLDVLDRDRRRALAAHIRAERERRDAARYELLDQAIARLVARHRGIPRDKIDGLIEIGALGGLSPAEVQARLRRHRVIDPVPAAAARPAAPAGPVVSAQRRRQVRDLLDEFGRLNETPPPSTLFSLLGLGPDAPDEEIGLCADAWRVRCRELPPLRIRAVADELLIHVQDLLESGRAMVEAYLDAVAEDIADRLRPRVRAAVLVEDRLVAEDHAHLLGEAVALGLDEGRARRMLASIAAELGVPVETGPTPHAPPPPRQSSPGSAPAAPPRQWEVPLRSARAALRGGRLLEAQRLVEDARRVAGADGAIPVRAVSDEIAEALAEASLRWRAASTALEARRFAEAAEHLEYLRRTAVDVPGPGGAGDVETLLRQAEREVTEADRRVEAALASPDHAAALLAVLVTWPEHPAALNALAAIPVHPPGRVTAVRDSSGSVIVSWGASRTTNVTYRVMRRGGDGTWRVVTRTPSTSVADGGAPAGSVIPLYAVTANQAGRRSEEVQSGVPAPRPPVAQPAATQRPPAGGTQPAPAAAPAVQPPSAAAPAQLPAPTDVRAERAPDGTVIVRWAGPPGAEFKVSRQSPDGRWRVLGRTRESSIEDGGVPAGSETPAYEVVAQVGNRFSPEALSRPK